MNPKIRKFAAVGLLVFGVELWSVLLRNQFARQYNLYAIAIVLAICLIWPLSNQIAKVFDAVSDRLSRHSLAMSCTMAAITAAYLLWHCFQDRDALYLNLPDEHVYMIQAQMVARGRLWLAAYPREIQPFFESAYLLQRPVYAPIYFPGTALLLAPFVRLAIPYWLVMTLISSLAAGMFYWITAELFKPVRAVVAVFMLVSLSKFQWISGLLLSEAPLIFWTMLMLVSVLQWRKNKSRRWLILLGIATGFAGITRPLEAICFALPIGIMISVDLFQLPRRNALKAMAIIALAASPFLGLQLVQNKGITGHWLRFPMDLYTSQYWPANTFGFHKIDLAAAPRSEVKAVQALNEKWIWGEFQKHTPGAIVPTLVDDRLPHTIEYGLPNPMLIILFPLALLACWDIRRVAVALPLILFLGLYIFNVFYLPHYAPGIAASMILIVLLGMEGFEKAWPNLRAASAFFTITAIALCIGALPEVNRLLWARHNLPENYAARVALADLPESPALVLFHYDPKVNDPEDDAVYNDSTAWPDDALIIRARDLGPAENQKLFQYYADHQPGRKVYEFDRGKPKPLSALGAVGELAARK